MQGREVEERTRLHRPSPSSAFVCGLTFPTPGVRNNQSMLFYNVVSCFVFVVVRTRHFFS